MYKEKKNMFMYKGNIYSLKIAHAPRDQEREKRACRERRVRESEEERERERKRE